MNTATSILGLVGELAPIAQQLLLGTITEQEARAQVAQAFAEHQQQLAQLDQALQANDGAADAAAAALPVGGGS
jgi:hypothetical protein